MLAQQATEIIYLCCSSAIVFDWFKKKGYRNMRANKRYQSQLNNVISYLPCLPHVKYVLNKLPSIFVIVMIIKENTKH